MQNHSQINHVSFLCCCLPPLFDPKQKGRGGLKSVSPAHSFPFSTCPRVIHAVQVGAGPGHWGILFLLRERESLPKAEPSSCSHKVKPRSLSLPGEEGFFYEAWMRMGTVPWEVLRVPNVMLASRPCHTTLKLSQCHCWQFSAHRFYH